MALNRDWDHLHHKVRLNSKPCDSTVFTVRLTEQSGGSHWTVTVASVLLSSRLAQLFLPPARGRTA